MVKLNRKGIVYIGCVLNKKWSVNKICKSVLMASNWINNTIQLSLQVLFDLISVLEVAIQKFVRQDKYITKIKFKL